MDTNPDCWANYFGVETDRTKFDPVCCHLGQLMLRQEIKSYGVLCQMILIIHHLTKLLSVVIIKIILKMFDCHDQVLGPMIPCV